MKELPKLILSNTFEYKLEKHISIWLSSLHK